MKKIPNKTEARTLVEEFFKRPTFSSEEMRKMKKLAMKYKIRLGEYRKFFCKACLAKLEGKIRASGEYKNIICERCGNINRQRISLNK